MKKLGITALLSVLFLAMFGFIDLFAFADSSGGAVPVYGTWISILPPLVAIGFALATREVVLSLFAGIWIGALFLVDFNPITATSGSLDVMLEALVDPDHMAIIVFSLLLGGMVGVMSRGGGTKGIVDVLEKFAKDRFSGQLFTWFSALFIFLMITQILSFAVMHFAL
jgi:Na+/H+ antiporter NhaC